ncbi:MAG: MFS transporter [Candidatus Bathyarchaeota archaeon]|nr:MFS transporter [Candidatus Bathyarchaeota archaeon]
MNRNVKVVFSSGLLSAFITGVFELLFPLYLNHRGISLVGMGLIFSISTLIISFLRILLGEYADVYGKKKVYLSSCALGIAAKGIFPFSAGELEILFSKFLNDLQANLRFSVHNIMLYENAKKAYAKIFSRFTASNFVLQAVGTLSFAVFLAYLGYSGLFFLLATVEMTKFITVLFYRDVEKEKVGRKVSLREAYRFKINRNLKLLALSSAIGTLGFGIAHGFLLPLYFVGRYGLDAAQISLITAVHRLSFLTTPLADSVINRLGLRRTYILTTSVYAISFLSVGLVAFPILFFVPVFIAHDLLGGGIRMTTMNVIMQNLTADDTRGRDINAFNAIQTPMRILAPSVAAVLAAASWDYIFIVGGLLYVVSLAMFCLFFRDRDIVSPSLNE